MGGPPDFTPRAPTLEDRVVALELALQVLVAAAFKPDQDKLSAALVRLQNEAGRSSRNDLTSPIDGLVRTIIADLHARSNRWGLEQD